MTEREDVAEDELLEILNRELAEEAGCEDVRFTGAIRPIASAPADEPNWDGRGLELEGRPVPLPCYAAANRVIEAARQRYRVTA